MTAGTALPPPPVPPPAPPAPSLPSSVAFFSMLAGVGAATVGAVVVGNGNLPISCAPVLGAAAVYGLCTVQLRRSAAALVFLALALDGTGNGGGLWHTPWAILGDLFSSNIDAVVPASRRPMRRSITIERTRLPGMAKSGRRLSMVSRTQRAAASSTRTQLAP